MNESSNQSTDPTGAEAFLEAERLRRTPMHKRPNQRRSVIAYVLARRDGFYGISLGNSATNDPNERAYEMADAILEVLDGTLVS